MKRSTHAVFLVLALVLALAAPSPVSAALQAPADQPAAAPPVTPTAQDGTLAKPVAGPEAGDRLCLDGPAAAFGLEPLAPLAPRPQTGAPCCKDLCDQICGVGEACLCKRCQVLGCGV